MVSVKPDYQAVLASEIWKRSVDAIPILGTGKMDLRGIKALAASLSAELGASEIGPRQTR